MNILIPMVAVGIVIIFFCLGIRVGSRFCFTKPSVMEQMLSAKYVPVSPVEASAENGTNTEALQRRIEEDRKAFEQCMKYSIKTAYGEEDE